MQTKSGMKLEGKTRPEFDRDFRWAVGDLIPGHENQRKLLDWLWDNVLLPAQARLSVVEDLRARGREIATRAEHREHMLWTLLQMATEVRSQNGYVYVLIGDAYICGKDMDALLNRFEALQSVPRGTGKGG